jgi:ribose/xylose/arabinose/galactoside ABC-type transport system permease subunit
VRERWFDEPSRGGIVLLATWPWALLFPAAVPFGLGQVMERSLATLANWLQDSPFLGWLPAPDSGFEPLVPAAELVCVLLGLLIPCLLGFCVIRDRLRRMVFTLMTLAVGILVTGLSSALSWGPEHTWAWLDLPAQWGLASGLVLALGLAMVSWRVSAALAVLALGVYLSMLNQAPANPYFAQTLQTWEQGRFIRFHGLGQWLGWLWPYAALAYVLSRVWVRGAKN